MSTDPAVVTSRPAARDTWLDHVVLAVAFAALLSGFRVVITGSDWWVTTLLVSTLAGVTCAVLRGIGTRWVTPIAAAVVAVALTWIFVPETLWTVLPTSSTISALHDLSRAAEIIIIEEQAPVGAAESIVLVVAAAFGFLVVLADFLLARKRAAAFIGVLLLAMFAAPAMIAGTTPPVWLFLVVAALWLVLLRRRTSAASAAATTSAPAPSAPAADRERRGTVPTLAIAASALVVGVALPPALPDITAVAASWGSPPSQVFGSGINPMVELGQSLRRGSPVTALQYTTTLESPPYLKVATLRDFSGRTWAPSRSGDTGPFEGEAAIDDDIATSMDTTTITIDGLRSTMLPVPYYTTDIQGLEGEWGYERLGQTVRSRDSDTEDQEYAASSLTIEPTAEQMRALTRSDDPRLRPYLSLPAEVPASIRQTALAVTSDADNDYDRALALQDFLRNGDFVYSESAPVAGGYDGNGLEVLEEFLVEQAGYCVHFSSAMAVMARLAGIPSRIAVGYAPGSSTPDPDVYEVTSHDLHAWTELYFEGAGWVQFEPTPTVGVQTAFEEPAVDVPEQDPGAQPDAPEEEAPSTNPRTDDSVTPATTSGEGSAARTSAVTAVGLLLVAGVPWLLRRGRRRWRLVTASGSTDPLWRELQDTALDLGIPVSLADTPRSFAQRLAAQPDVDTDALDRLLLRVETSRFARGTTSADDGAAADLRLVLGSLRAGVGRRRRWRADLAPRSLAVRPARVAPIETGPAAATS